MTVVRRASLAAQFDELNRKFFGGRLPRYRVRAHPWPPPLGRVLPDKRTILLLAGLAEESRRRVLLHEMCHIGSPGHGKRFQAKLERLASMGEAWAREEIREIRAASRNGRPTHAASVKSTILALVRDVPNARWILARRTIGRVVGMTPRELIKSYPWTKDVWQRERENGGGGMSRRGKLELKPEEVQYEAT